ncbi:unnamed protein product [Dibothriocephalus latus]|uniref:Uncharacterized protein n=1 Tax=Dibothriocephalus latus TaxID=60516 RepID=A0A3P7QKJ5_DIBLA|nr:unnamed protein product [Dibothriocephalus latus]
MSQLLAWKKGMEGRANVIAVPPLVSKPIVELYWCPETVAVAIELLVDCPVARDTLRPLSRSIVWRSVWVKAVGWFALVLALLATLTAELLAPCLWEKPRGIEKSEGEEADGVEACASVEASFERFCGETQ